MAPKPPWSIRKNRKSTEEFYVLRDGIPDGLMNSLLGFLDSHFCGGHHVRAERTEHLARIVGRSLPTYREELLNMFLKDESLLLDAIDHALAHPEFNIQHPYEAAQMIKAFLDDARSVYDVFHVDRGEYEIGYRQPPEITELVEQVTSDRSRAAEHLRRAWSLGFSREADPNAACIESIKAIEAAARTTIEPNNTRATLGTMIAAMNSKPTKWRTDLEAPNSDDLETIIGMMKMVWKGHLRHGNPNDPLDVSEEQCEMIVHTAALLVHWFLSGRVRQA